MSAFCPEGCPDADACVVGYPCALHPVTASDARPPSDTDDEVCGACGAPLDASGDCSVVGNRRHSRPPSDTEATTCWCSQWDEETNTMHRCMTRALDLGCCGGDGPCGCSPVDKIERQVAMYAVDNPGALDG